MHVGEIDPLHVADHDKEWGVPVHDNRNALRSGDFLVLEGAQASLSWLTSFLQSSPPFRNGVRSWLAQESTNPSTWPTLDDAGSRWQADYNRHQSKIAEGDRCGGSEF